MLCSLRRIIPSQRSPAHSNRLMIVLRLTPVSRSVERIEQPSNRQCKTRHAVVQRDSHCAKRVRLRFTKCGFAGTAAVTLDSRLAVVTEFLRSIVLTTDAGHGQPCLLAWQAVTFRCVGIAASPACRLALFASSRWRQGVVYVWWPRRDSNPQSAPLRKG